MKRIWLSSGRSALVDDDQYEWLNQFKWSVAHRNKSGLCYAVRRNEDGIFLYMHREIMDMSDNYPVPRELFIDHLDGNGLNNLRRNLKAVTSKENTRRYHARRARRSLV